MESRRQLCVLDHLTVCPRNYSGALKLCPCKEVYYCGPVCQKFHWQLHKLNCKIALKGREPNAGKIIEKMEAYLRDTNHLLRTAESSVPPPLSSLTEDQKDSVRKALMSARGDISVIQRVAEELGEHPLVIAAGTITFENGMQRFKKGDIAASLAKTGKVWDGNNFVPGYQPRTWTVQEASARREQVLREIAADRSHEERLLRSLLGTTS